jgi:hypothetical protein
MGITDAGRALSWSTVAVLVDQISVSRRIYVRTICVRCESNWEKRKERKERNREGNNR